MSEPKIDQLHLPPSYKRIKQSPDPLEVLAIGCSTTMSQADERSSESPTRSADGDAAGHEVRKRRRVALSCYTCKKRKLRCDREYPACTRCIKSGVGDKCVYDSETNKTFLGPEPLPRGSPQATGAAATTAFAQGQNRNGVLSAASRAAFNALDTPQKFPPPTLVTVATSEGRTRPAARIDNLASSTFHYDPIRDAAQLAEPELIRGRGFRTHFLGISSGVSSVSFLRESTGINQTTFTTHSLGRMKKDFKVFNQRRKQNQVEAIARSDADLLAFIPDRPTCDALVKLYLDSFECCYHILHIPSFKKDYESFWATMRCPRPGFLAVLLLMLACTKPIRSDPRELFIGDSSVSRETACLWIRTCQSWLNHQSHKHSNLAMFQAHCLLVIAKLINDWKRKRDWMAAGHSVQYFMTSGFHRDPAPMKGFGTKTTQFEYEMRRRLWATITELELDVSISQGMQSIVDGKFTDVGVPRNINDDELTEDMLHLPNSRPDDQYTDGSWLSVSRRSYALRNIINTAINDPASTLEWEEVLRLEGLLNQEIANLPIWARQRRTASSPAAAPDSEEARIEVASALLDCRLRTLLIFLHGRFARQKGPDSRFAYSRMATLNAAHRILDSHFNLTDRGNFSLAMLRGDLFRSAFSICHCLYIARSVQDDIVGQSLTVQLTPMVEKTILITEQTIMRLGRDYHGFLVLAAAYSLIAPQPQTPDNRDEPKIDASTQALERTVSLLAKILERQDPAAVNGGSGVLGGGLGGSNTLNGGAGSGMGGTNTSFQPTAAGPGGASNFPTPSTSVSLTALIWQAVADATPVSSSTAPPDPGSFPLTHPFPLITARKAETETDIAAQNSLPAIDDVLQSFDVPDPSLWTFDDLWNFDASGF